MTERPSDGIGERVAAYRKLAGLTADELAKRAGTMSRSKLANIESGRKKNVTIDDLIDLAYALEVPLTALAVPLDRPYARIQVGQSHDVPAWALAESFHTRRDALVHQMWTSDGESVPVVNAARHVAMMRLTALTDYMDIAFANVVGDEGAHEVHAADVKELEQRLASLGVDLTEKNDVAEGSRAADLDPVPAVERETSTPPTPRGVRVKQGARSKAQSRK